MNRAYSDSQAAPASQSVSCCRLSVIVIAKDAAATIASTLQSLRFCDEIIVSVDDTSSDGTERIARGLATKVALRRAEGFPAARRHALSMAQGEWVLMIDADEIVTPALAQSIMEIVIASPSRPFGYQLRRRTNLLGRYLKHGDWGRDRVLRFVRRDKARIRDVPVHESFEVDGLTQLLDGWLLHQGDRTIESLVARQNRYAALSAQAMFDKGRGTSLLAIILKPPFRFLRSYVLRLGFLDGWPGFVEAWYSAVYVFTRYATLREMRRAKPS